MKILAVSVRDMPALSQFNLLRVERNSIMWALIALKSWGLLLLGPHNPWLVSEVLPEHCFPCAENEVLDNNNDDDKMTGHLLFLSGLL